MLEGPKQFLKLPFEKQCHHICCHETLPFILRTNSNSLHNYNLQASTQIQTQVKTDGCEQIQINQDISDIGGINYSRGNLIYYSPNYLYINQHKIHVHQGFISKALTDDFGIIMTCGHDQTIKITSARKREIMSEFNFHYHPITEMFWHNSLGITGDSAGEVCLWDVNKCQQITHRKIHYESVDFLGAYVDYTTNNIFYTVNKSQKRLILSDMRTNKAIRIIANLHSEDIVNVKHNNSGKIFVAYTDIIDVIDLYQEYRTVGNFSPVVADKNTQMKWTKNKFSYDNIRQITGIQIIGKYLIAACSNGSIQMYDSDILQCLYGFGLGQVGPIKQLVCNKNKQAFCIDGDGSVYMVKL